MLTPIQYKALVAISKGSYQRGISARALAWSLWGENPEYEYLFSAASNQGEGACHGKKAWLCAGSLAGKLRKAGYVQDDQEFSGYCLTSKGEAAIREYDAHNGN